MSIYPSGGANEDFTAEPTKTDATSLLTHMNVLKRCVLHLFILMMVS